MKIHEYNEMMAYLTRPAMKTGGRIGYGIGDIVKPIPRVGKVYASGEKIIEYGTKAIEILESTLASTIPGRNP